MPNGYLVSRDLLRQIQRDHNRIKYELKHVVGQVSRLSAVAPVRDEQIIAQATADIAALDDSQSEPVVTSGTFKVLFLDRADNKLKQMADYEVTGFNLTSDVIEADSFVTLHRNSVTGKWCVGNNSTSTGTEIIQFRLNEDLQAYQRPSDTDPQYWYADCDKVTWAYDSNHDDSTDNGLTLGVTDGGADVTVVDPVGQFRGAKGPRTDSLGNSYEGCTGYAVKLGGFYQIIECETVAKWVKFRINNTAGYSQSDYSWTIRILDHWQGVHPGAITDAKNFLLDNVTPTTYLFEGIDYAVGMAVYDEIDDLYRIVQMEINCGTS